MKLIVLSDTKLIQKEHETINTLFESGMQCFHLRKPEACKRTLEQLLKSIKPEFLKHIVVHNHYPLVFRYQLRGIHLPEYVRKALAPSDFSDLLYRLRAQHMTISTSVHQKATLLKIDGRFDYIFYSPVFSSISKTDYGPSEDIDVARLGMRTQVIGLGGVHEENIHQLPKMGYRGAAVLGAIWNRPEHAVDHFKLIQQICQNNVLMC